MVKEKASRKETERRHLSWQKFDPRSQVKAGAHVRLHVDSRRQVVVVAL